MGEDKDLFGDLENISKEIEKHIRRIRKRLEKAPEGSLRVSKAHGTCQFYNKTELCSLRWYTISAWASI